MFRKTSMLAAAGLMALSSIATQASAQIAVTVNVKNTEVFSSNSGGAWGAQITGAGLPNFIFGTAPGNTNLPIVYCFDSTRQFAFNTNLSMTLLTFDQFIAGNPVPAINPWGNIDKNDLNGMAGLASTYTANVNTQAVRNANGTIQQNIWNISNGLTNAPANSFDLSDNWMVLVDTQDWTGVGGGNRTNGSQSFLVRIEPQAVVPEPSSMVLLVAGFGAVAVFSRRRRDTVA
jgi:hypothetical protein